nr:DUF3320 domain-containing protein [Kineosporia babensis]
MTARNRLLNFKPTRTSSVEMADPDLERTLSVLLADQEFVFRSLAPAGGADPAFDAEVPGWIDEENSTDEVLHSRAPLADLNAALRSLLRKSGQEYLDRGVWVLYLAFGSLEWKDETGAPYRSPLILVPVELYSPGRRAAPRLKLAQEDPTPNPALALRLAQMDVQLPTFEDLEGLDIAWYLAGVEAAVRSSEEDRQDWQVRKTLHLSYFSFAKEAMYRDLLENEGRIAEHAGIQALALGPGESGSDFDFDEIPDDRIDELAPAEATPLVLDADSSQRACVAAALAGKSFVMDGPPGTGKSQTISNMIGALLYAGKSVLFVSEKAAALDVVRNRLGAAGLGSFLLELHSHKATRKEVALALGDALENDVQVDLGPVTGEDRRQLRARQDELNEYAAAMNLPRAPLNLTLHEVLGRIAQLDTVAAVSVKLQGVQELTPAAFGEIRQAAEGLSRSWQPALTGEAYLWRGVTLRTSFDAVLYQAGSTLRDLRTAGEPLAPLAEAFGLNRPSDVPRLFGLAELDRHRPEDVPRDWITSGHLDELDQVVGDLRSALQHLARIDADAEQVCGVSWTAVPSPSVLPPLPSNVSDLSEMTAEGAHEIARLFGAAANMLTQRQGHLDDIATALHTPTAQTIDEATQLLSLAAVAAAPHRPEAGWFTPDGHQRARTALTAIGRAMSDRDQARRAAEPLFTPSILAGDLTGLEQRFTQTHRGWRKLLGGYRADKQQVAAGARDAANVRAAIEGLPLARAWQQAEQSLQRVLAEQGPALGRYFREGATDLQLVSHLLATSEQMLGLGFDVSAAGQVLGNGSVVPAWLPGLAAEVERDLLTWQSMLVPGSQAGMPLHLQNHSFPEIVSWLREQLAPAEAVAAFTGALSQALHRDLKFRQAQRILATRQSTEAEHVRFTEENGHRAAVLRGLYHGAQTDLSALDAAVGWARAVRAHADRPGEVLTEVQAQALEQVPAGVDPTDAYGRWEEASGELLAAFDSGRRAELQVQLDDFDRAADFLEALASDPGGRDEWFAYLDNRAVMATHGLDAAVDFCIRERLAADHVRPVIERCVLQAWADHFLLTDRALRTSRAADRDDLVQQYRTLDRKLIERAVVDIVEACRGRRPRSDVGQSAVIRREAEKKRKHMPVRELINRTRNVTQALKPCFMMSPLSVSQYLPADLEFDVVIFDEASQVSPSDAVNCIYRGRSLITAGDKEQLPPTNFFGTGGGNDDDWHEDEEGEEAAPDLDGYESILDLTKSSGVLRSLTLRWHYRSRHEDLISFSNHSFYKNRLITFPGAQESGPDIGVEFFPVDGVYRRNGARDNPIEAELVAQRVMHHFSTRPNRSLGVVAFSESQAACIENAVERARAANPHLDRFFGDGRLDGFFVKNLESVQGDERDVMIFSIGYGPDENGRTLMNFGPLNKSGGQRRLNVAVTRARYRNEVIASITASDITSATTSEGARQLRKYLDFAARGAPALYLDGATGGDVESPFEESVITAIRHWGYEVEPQVGAAGYRIDMAVRHPDRREVFVLGVECDGFQYHSSKVARDRDRLREGVLNGLGWRLHRIWGTAWNRNRSGEEQRLREAIEQAIHLPVSGLLTEPPVPVLPTVSAQPAAPAGPPEWTVPYEVADIALSPDVTVVPEVMRALEQIVQVEGPIHATLLDRRLRDLLGVGRIGARIRTTIDQAIDGSSRLERDGDFVGFGGSVIDTVRVPAHDCLRKIEQVHDSELSIAVVNLVRDAGGIDIDSLIEASARVFGWTRVSAEVKARISAVVETQTQQGALARQGADLVAADPDRKMGNGRT